MIWLFGLSVYPKPSLAEFPVLLALSAPVIRAYLREAFIEEKLTRWSISVFETAG
jgi:hypothetical protein